MYVLIVIGRLFEFVIDISSPLITVLKIFVLLVPFPIVISSIKSELTFFKSKLFSILLVSCTSKSSYKLWLLLKLALSISENDESVADTKDTELTKTKINNTMTYLKFI